MARFESRLQRLESCSRHPAHRGTLVVPCRPGESEDDALRRWDITPSEWSEVKFGQLPPGYQGQSGPVFVPYGPTKTLVEALNEALARAYGTRDANTGTGQIRGA